ncbi:MAG: hypothetical protein MJZ34_11310 [Paludibacteraceae bacterium]|nr:hypothetical protein [Paludibacteraceae bacterium]
MNCLICQKEFDSIRHLSLHLKSHKMGSREYYDKFLKKEFEGICTCGNETKFLDLTNGYQRFCCSRCANTNEETKEKNKNAHDYKSILEKSKKTKLKRYGNETYTNTEKMKNTSNERYGGIGFGVKEIKEKALEPYGVDNFFQLESVKEKSKKTKLERYGNETYQNREQIEKTNIAKYGYNTPSKNSVVKERLSTSLKNAYELDKETILEKRNETYNKKYGIGFREYTKIRHQEEYIPRWNKLFSEKFDTTRLTTHTFRCNKCDDVYIVEHPSNGACYCRKCHKFVRSQEQENIANEIRKFYNGEIIENDRTILNGKELDIYIPEFKLAIEYNGLYWHKEYEPSYHLENTNKCEGLGIRLLQVWDVVYKEHKEIILDKIKSCMGMNNRIFARKCSIKEISVEVYKEFCLKYHIQGFVNSKYRYGLFNDNELVAIGSFGKSRFENEMELLRYCSKSGISVIGGMKKIVAHFKKTNHIDEVISYADRRYTASFNNVYGTPIGKTRIGYYYFDGHRLYNRLNFQKHKLKDNPLTKDFYDDALTESEICMLSSLYKIYDLGQLKFKL